MSGEPGPERDDLQGEIERQIARAHKARQERRSLMAQTAYIGVLGLLFVLPVILGAYLGRWLDVHASGYSVSWTVNLICLGVIVGAINVYLFIRER